VSEANLSDSQAPEQATGLTLMQAVAVGVNTTSPAFSLAAILAPMALLVGYATPVVLVVSFVPMALTSLAFMYLNRRDPDCGTTFSWVTRAIGPKSGFLAGWAIAAAGVLVLGSLAETAVTYGLLTFGLDGLAANRTLIIFSAAGLIVLMTGLSILGSDSSIRLQTVLTYVQVAILLGFAVAAAVLAVRSTLPAFSSDWYNPLAYGLEPLISAMLLGVFAFWGWEAATNLSEECKRPSDAGKAGVLSTIILLSTYVLVAIFVVMYLGESDFYPVGESGLVLVDMSGVVLGPFAFLVLVAVALSAVASTQSTMVPGSRAVLSMARRGALPARLGLTHPRFKSPWVALVMLGGLAASWYVVVSLISENALTDTLSSLGILVAFYYSITGLACVFYYRKHIKGSLRGFLLVGVGPVLGSLGLAFMLIVGIRSVSDPASSASGVPWLGLAPPLAIAALMMILGIAVLIIRRFLSPEFFQNGPEVANRLQSPFPLGTDLPIPPGGVLIDCNATAEKITERLTMAPDGWQVQRPVSLTFGIHPAGISGEEFHEARESLIEEGHDIFMHVTAAVRAQGVREVLWIYEEGDAHQSVEMARERANPSVVI